MVLASASPRRAQLLSQIGVPHRVLPADIDERRAAGEDAEQCVLRLARQKAQQVCRTLQEQAALRRSGSTPLPVLGADTVVVVDGELLGKPRDRADALAMLARLSGRAHLVLSAVALASATELRSALSRSEVRFRRLSLEECTAYWDSGEPCDKAGAYAIQGRGAVFVEQLRGSYSGVMGLPLYETALLLADAGVPVWVP